jgi:hypothetical protein
MSSRADKEELKEINRVLNYDNVGHFSNFHDAQRAFLEP